MTEFRRYIHQHPETGFKEWKTREYIQNFLFERGVQPDQIRTFAETGFVVDVKGTGPESTTPKCIALRADMDALVMDEGNPDLPYRSVNDRAAHMCGHDGHMASLTGFGWFLLQHLDKLPSNWTVRLLYQPAEEGPGGAKPMIDEGVLEGVDEVYGFHNSPEIDLGGVFWPDREIMAHSNRFYVTVTGKGGHGAYPQLNKDALLASCMMINNLQSILGRNLSCHDKAVFSVCACHAGTSYNIMPNQSQFYGTFRDYSTDVWDTVTVRMKEICNGIAASMDVDVDIEIIDYFPATINHPQNALAVRQAATRALGPEHVVMQNPSLGGEDFAFYLLGRPGAFFFIGTGYKHMIWHEINYDYNDEVTPIAVKMYAAIIEDRMGFKFS